MEFTTNINAPITQSGLESRTLNALGVGSNPTGGTKVCCTCKLEKDSEDFHIRKKAKDGLQSSCKLCNNVRAQQWQAKNPTYYLTRTPRRAVVRHHLTEEQYAKLLAVYEGKCWSCKENEQNLGIDHDHACCSGQWSCGKCVRGLLCVQCNTALGLLKDSKKRILSLLDYLESS